ncbi:MAG: hypothetical protein KKA84_10105 [Bacteroidetes bacterium]|nr:hypothetical protein [Bacteroidota bacterium]
MEKTFKEFYDAYESKIVEKLFQDIIEIFKSEERAPYLTIQCKPKPDEFLELKTVTENEIYFNRLKNNPADWKISFDQLMDAIRYSVRNGRKLKASEYKRLYGTSNYVGIPLNILIHLLPEEVYTEASLAGSKIDLVNLGEVTIVSLELNEDVIVVLHDNTKKRLSTIHVKVNEDDVIRE